MNVFNIIAAAIGLIASIWAIVDPQNGPLRFLRNIRVTTAVPQSKAKQVKAKPVRKPLEIKLPVVLKHILSIIIAFALMSAAIFLTTLAIKRNTLDFAYSHLFPNNVFDYKSAVSFFDLINKQTALGDKLRGDHFFFWTPTDPVWVEQNKKIDFVFLYNVVCFSIFNIFSIAYVKRNSLQGRLNMIGLIAISEFLILLAIICTLTILFFILNFFIQVDYHYKAMAFTVMYYGIIFCSPMITYILRWYT